MKFPRVSFPFLVAAWTWAALTACTQESGPVLSGPEPVALEDELGPAPVKPVLPAGWPEAWPADNPYTPEKALLGRRLFFDARLSSDGLISCAWCHDPRGAFTNIHGGHLATGVRNQALHRGPPTLLNVAFVTTLMSDGSAASLEDQVRFPLRAPHEMDMTEPEAVAVLKADSVYQRLFRRAFGPGEITFEAMARALATYQRTLVSVSTPYDRWVAGDTGALPPAARAGFKVFMGKGNCAACHAPPLFTDDKFHDTGLDPVPLDSGRMRVTGLPADLGRFRTPTLRNLPVTAPYMHDGRFWTLEEVVEFYNAGGTPGATPDSGVRPLGLTGRETYDLVEFLRVLSDEAPVGRVQKRAAASGARN